MDNLPFAITKALGYTENNGKPNVKNPSKGKSGELKSVFQFMPDTWNGYSKEITGKAGLPLTPDNETHVALGKVTQWVKKLRSEGIPDTEIPLKIASMWNAGEQNPDAYKQNYKGTNKEGVAYNTPAYAKKVSQYTQQFLNQPQNNPQPSQPAQPSGLVSLPKQQSTPPIQGLVSSLLPPQSS